MSDLAAVADARDLENPQTPQLRWIRATFHSGCQFPQSDCVRLRPLQASLANAGPGEKRRADQHLRRDYRSAITPDWRPGDSTLAQSSARGLRRDYPMMNTATIADSRGASVSRKKAIPSSIA
jgi:hypothetical protein